MPWYRVYLENARAFDYGDDPEPLEELRIEAPSAVEALRKALPSPVNEWDFALLPDGQAGAWESFLGEEAETWFAEPVSEAWHPPGTDTEATVRTDNGPKRPIAMGDGASRPIRTTELPPGERNWLAAAFYAVHGIGCLVVIVAIPTMAILLALPAVLLCGMAWRELTK